MRAETTLYKDLKASSEQYTEALIREAEVKSAIDEIVNLKNELKDLKDESKLTFGQSTLISLKALGKDGLCRLLFYETRLLYQLLTANLVN